MHSRLRPLALFLLVFAASCTDGAAARVNGTELTRASLEREISMMRANPAYVAHPEETSPGAVRDEGGVPTRAFVATVLTMRIHYAVLEQETSARRLKPGPDDLERGELIAAEDAGGPGILRVFRADYRDELVRRGTLLAALRRDVVKGTTSARYYRSNREEFVKPCSRHLVVSTEEAALAARARIRSGAAFAAVAEESSLDEGTAPKGGDLGCNGVGDLTPELDRASIEQDVGVVGPPLRTPAGWQLLLVYERKTPSLAGVRGEVAGAIRELAERRVGRALSERFEDARIEVSDRYGRWDKENRKVDT